MCKYVISAVLFWLMFTVVMIVLTNYGVSDKAKMCATAALVLSYLASSIDLWTGKDLEELRMSP